MYPQLMKFSFFESVHIVFIILIVNLLIEMHEFRSTLSIGRITKYSRFAFCFNFSIDEVNDHHLVCARISNALQVLQP